MHNFRDDILALIDQQIVSWPTAAESYAALAEVRRKTVDFDGFRLDVQFNPGRVRSTTAPADPAGRPCFLCPAGRAPQQRGVAWRGYEVLVNPYPIFGRHLTIPAVIHTPQRLTGRTRDLLDLAAALPGFTILFNGARAGASAPDHFHFQAVESRRLPACTELPGRENRETLYDDNEISVRAVDGYLRPAVVIEGADTAALARASEAVLACLGSSLDAPDQAQVNALSWCGEGVHTLALFPRTARRPREYDAPEPERFLFSPGAVELAGTEVTVRAEDFERADAPTLARLFSQVVPDDALWQSIKNDLRACLPASLK